MSTKVKIRYQPGFGSAMAPGPAPTDFGRVFGVPGFEPGQPGWAGRAGVAQIPNLGRGSDFGSRPPKTYGSLGYGSMGTGSMDMAARTFSGIPTNKSHKPKRNSDKSNPKRSHWGVI